MKKILFTLLLFFILVPFKVSGENQYQVIIQDDANLLNESEEAELKELMTELSEFGNVMFVSVDENDMTAAEYAQSTYHQTFGSDSGTLFLIDMDNRYIYIFSDGLMYQTITKTNALTITDNAYTYASSGDYLGCAKHVFSQELTLMNNGEIARPMKYINNALFAGIGALLLNYGLLRLTTNSGKDNSQNIISGAVLNYSLSNPEVLKGKLDKIYSPVESSSGEGSSGGSRSSGGGGGGGHSSGGGGGHRF